MGGGTSTTSVQTVTPPPKTAAETELDDINLRIARSQEKQLRTSQALQDPQATLDSNLKGFEDLDSPAFREQLQQQVTRNAQGNQLMDLAQRDLIARVQGKKVLTEDEQKLVDQMYGSAQARGEEDIQQFGREQANVRGMTTADSPVGNEMIRERGRLALGLESAKAETSLNLGQGNKAFEAGITQFQEGLRQQALMNRLALSTTNPSSFNLASSLAGQRFAQATTTTNTETRKNLGVGDYIGMASSLAGGFGSAGVGLGMMGYKPFG